MNYADYFIRLEKIQRWINNDLENASVNAQANFLVAMGVFNYIEILGSFYEHDGTSTARFNFVFNNLLNNEYQQVFSDIQQVTGSAYGCLRCGMTHEYAVKTYQFNNSTSKFSYTIYGVNNKVQYDKNINDINCGLVLEQNGNDYHLDIYNPRFIHDLNEAFEEFKARLSSNQSGYRDRFIKRCENISLENFN